MTSRIRMEVSSGRKEELRLSIMARRHARGEKEVSADSKEPRVMEMSSLEKAKKERRREQNRRAAQRCRTKKRLSQCSIIQSFQRIAEQNQQLRQEVLTLRKQRDELQKIIDHHQTTCPCFTKVKVDPDVGADKTKTLPTSSQQQQQLQHPRQQQHNQHHPQQRHNNQHDCGIKKEPVSPNSITQEPGSGACVYNQFGIYRPNAGDCHFRSSTAHVPSQPHQQNHPSDHMQAYPHPQPHVPPMLSDPAQRQQTWSFPPCARDASSLQRTASYVKIENGLAGKRSQTKMFPVTPTSQFSQSGPPCFGNGKLSFSDGLQKVPVVGSVPSPDRSAQFPGLCRLLQTQPSPCPARGMSSGALAQTGPLRPMNSRQRSDSKGSPGTPDTKRSELDRSELDDFRLNSVSSESSFFSDSHVIMLRDSRTFEVPEIDNDDVFPAGPGSQPLPSVEDMNNNSLVYPNHNVQNGGHSLNPPNLEDIILMEFEHLDESPENIENSINAFSGSPVEDCSNSPTTNSHFDIPDVNSLLSDISNNDLFFFSMERHPERPEDPFSDMSDCHATKS